MIIQVPRLYDIYRANNNVKNFQDIIRNLFEVLQIQNKTESFFYNIYLPQPLFEVTNDPSSHPNLHRFLKVIVYPQCDLFQFKLTLVPQHVTGFDSVDDESKPENAMFDSEVPTPDR